MVRGLIAGIPCISSRKKQSRTTIWHVLWREGLWRETMPAVQIRTSAGGGDLTSLCLTKPFPNLQFHRVDWQTLKENFVGIIQRLNLVSFERPTWILRGALDLLLRTALGTCFDISKFCILLIDSIYGCRKILRINTITLRSPWPNKLICIRIIQVHFNLLVKPGIGHLIASSGFCPGSNHVRSVVE